MAATLIPVNPSANLLFGVHNHFLFPKCETKAPANSFDASARLTTDITALTEFSGVIGPVK